VGSFSVRVLPLFRSEFVLLFVARGGAGCFATTAELARKTAVDGGVRRPVRV